MLWTKHIQLMLRNVKYQYRAFSRAIKYFDHDTRIMMYNSSIASRMNYADSIWNYCTVRDSNMLQSVQNMSVRRMLNARPLENCQPLLMELGMLTLENKRTLRSMVLFYNLVNGQGPKALIEELQKYNFPNRGQLVTRMDNSKRFFIPSYNTDYKGNSFFVKAIKIWNRLPEDVRNASKSEMFKNKLYRLMLTTGSAGGRH